MQAKNILIIGPAWVGDMVMVQSLFKALLQQNKNTYIDVVAPAWSAPVLARMPEVQNVIEVDIGHGQLHLGKRASVGKSLRNKYEQAIVLPRSFKSALIPFFAKVPQRTGYRGEMRYGLINDMRPLNEQIYKAVDKFVALGRPKSNIQQATVIQFPSLVVDEEKRAVAANRLGIALDTPSVALMPGAEFGPSKRWPSKYFAQLAVKLRLDGYKVYVFGSPKDATIGAEIEALSNGEAKNLCGQTSLEDAVDLLSLVKLAITNDSGLMHIAAAVGRPVVALYGSITPKYTPPLTDNAEIQYLNLDCSPCWKKECPYGHYNCMQNLEVSRVYESAKKLLRKP